MSATWLCLAAVATAPGAAPDELEGPLDLSEFPADFVEQVVVPVPGEILAVLDKLGESDWAAELRKLERRSFRSRADYALALGVAVAEGFVAVQAEDAAAVEGVGKQVLRYSEALGLRRAVTPHCEAIFEAAKAGEWAGVRMELDRAERTARTTMEKMDDHHLALVVSLGGWARGTEVASAVIIKSFTADKAELLNQPDLVRHFIVSIEEMKEDYRKEPKLIALAAAMETIEKLMGAGDKPVQSDAVVELNEAISAVVELVAGTGRKAGSEE